jgi:GT2 family glycosyltransferase
VTAVVIPTRDRADLLRRCTDSLDQQLGISDVIVVDNGGDEETEALCDERRFRQLRAGRNLSFSESCNWGMSVAATAEVLLLNNDATLHPHALSTLLEHHAPGITGTLVVDSTGSVNHAGVAFAGAMPTHVGRGDRLNQWYGEPCRSWPATTFAAVVVSRDIWKELGGLDEGYVYGYEDTDFCLRAAEHGYQTRVCYQAVATHDEFGTRRPGDDSNNAARFFGTWVVTGRAEAALRRLHPERVAGPVRPGTTSEGS